MGSGVLEGDLGEGGMVVRSWSFWGSTEWVGEGFGLDGERISPRLDGEVSDLYSL